MQAPDGTIWKIATSSKKETGPPTRAVDEVVLLLGVDDVKATKQFYVDRGLAVGKSFGSKYVEFETPGSAVKLALYSRRAAAKDAGVPPEGSGSHRIVVHGDVGSFTDPDGFAWESGVGLTPAMPSGRHGAAVVTATAARLTEEIAEHGHEGQGDGARTPPTATT